MSNDKFNELYSLNVNDKTEKRKSGSTELTYLSWSWAWSTFKKVYPDATYLIVKFLNKDNTLVPYMYDENTGYMVNTTVTAGGLTYEMWLPVMDSTNKAMKKEPYKVSSKYGGERTVEAATMFDINKTIMRCLTKNLAMFGLGLYIYAGEDLPESSTDDTEIFEKIKEFDTKDNLKKYYALNKDKVRNLKEFTNAVNERAKELTI